MDRVTEFLETEFANTEERAMLLGIATSPTDKTAKLVYADWLEERSDPRGEYVRLLVQRGRKKPTVRMRELRRECSGSWLSILGELRSDFDALTESVEAREERARGWRPCAIANFDRGLWDLHYTGNLWYDEEDGLAPVLDFVCQPDTASVLRSITLDAYEDHPQTNGTLHVSLGAITSGEAVFPYLESFRVDQSQNTILSHQPNSYQETGAAARVVAACPLLRVLAVPSAPNTDFFTGPPHAIEVLDVHTGYDTERFIPNLAGSNRFPKLRVLHYKDFCCEYTTPTPTLATPFEDWRAFFRSPVCAALETIELSGLVITQPQVRELLGIRSEGVSITRSPAAP